MSQKHKDDQPHSRLLQHWSAVGLGHRHQWPSVIQETEKTGPKKPQSLDTPIHCLNWLIAFRPYLSDTHQIRSNFSKCWQTATRFYRHFEEIGKAEFPFRIRRFRDCRLTDVADSAVGKDARSSAIAERPRDALCHLKSCQLLQPAAHDEKLYWKTLAMDEWRWKSLKVIVNGVLR